MTDERNMTDMTVGVDETVSRAYREVANESAPEHLNQAILAQARKAARPRYARLRAWTRPLAWAATVALSVAVVLEVTQLPAPDGASFDVSTPKFKLDEAEADVHQDAPLDALEEELPAAIAPRRASNFTPQAPQKTGLIHKTAAKSEPAFEKQKGEVSEKAAEPASADEITEMQYNDRDEAVRMQGFALSSSVVHCTEEMTQEPSTWLECIEELEASGHSDEASEQRRLLRETFPEFESS